MSESTYHRTRTPDGTGVTVRQTDRQIRLSVGSSQRLRCNTTEAVALLVTLAGVFGVGMTCLPDWAANAEIRVGDR